MIVGSKRLRLFIMLAFGWSWGCWLLSPVVRGHSPLLAAVLMWFGGFGPTLAAVALVWHQGGLAGLRTWLSQGFRWRVGWVWVAVALLLPLVVVSLAVAIHVALGGIILPSPAVGHALLAGVNFVLILVLGGPVGEEFGWRGYALPALQKRIGWRVASLVLGIVWGTWHLPLFYIANTSQQHIPVGLFMVSTVAMSVLFAWFANHTAGSLVVAILFHTAINYWSWIIPVVPNGGSVRPFEFVTGLMVLVALVLFLRKKSKSDLGNQIYG
jgi:uncharacterized protein